MMSQQDRNKHRALIVRRLAAQRVGHAQREIWRKRRVAQTSTRLCVKVTCWRSCPRVC